MKGHSGDFLNFGSTNSRERLMRLGRVCAVLFPGLLLVFALAMSALAADDAEWLTGKEYQRQLDATVCVTWVAAPLRSAIGNLSENQRVAVMLDRRVDPGRPVTFSSSGTTLRTLFENFARQEKLGLAIVGPVVYLGPEQTARRLATLVELRGKEIADLPADVRRRLRGDKRLDWTAPAEPRAVLGDLAKNYGIRAYQIEQAVPHDLWPTQSFPKLDFAQGLTLVLAGFDLTFEISKDGSAFRAIPMPQSPVVHREYTTGSRVSVDEYDLRKRFPRSTIQVRGSRVVVDGPVEDQQEILALLTAGRQNNSDTADKGEQKHLYTLTVTDKPVGPLLEQLAKKHLNLEIDFAPGITDEQKQRRVSFSLTEAELDALLKTILDQVGLTYRLEGASLHVLPKSP